MTMFIYQLRASWSVRHKNLHGQDKVELSLLAIGAPHTHDEQ